MNRLGSPWLPEDDEQQLVPIGDPLPVGCLQIMFMALVVLALLGLVWLWAM